MEDGQHFQKDDNKEEIKEDQYISKENKKKELIKEPKIEDKKISDNKEKQKGKPKKIKKKDVAKKLLFGDSDEEKTIKEELKKDKNDFIILKNAIKSQYIKKIVFSFLSTNKILNMIVHNKYYQNLLNIGIDNYKNISKRYIIGEINGKGKEYSIDKNILIFEGEYLNKKRNGKGIEYDNDGLLLFEGEYLNGKRNGKGKEYYFNGNLKFEGEYLNGERNGKGKEYFINGNLYFIGEYLKGKKWNGKGFNKYGGNAFRIKNGNGYILIYDTYDDLIFEGNYFNGEINGYGYEYENDGKNIKFEGEYLNGIRHGKGIEYNKFGETIFKGEYLNGKKWNCKMFDDNNKLIFELKNGKGFGQEYSFDCRDNYIGEFLNGERSGKGKEYRNNYPEISMYNNEEEEDIKYKLLFEGEYLDGKRNGKGKKYYEEDKGGLKFEGEYLNGKKWNGKGYDMNGKLAYEIKNGSGYVKKYFIFNNLKFEGEYSNGEKNGKGKEYDYNYMKFEGEYRNGKRHGKGKEYLNKKLIFEGEYLNGEKWNGKGNISFYGQEKEFELKNGTGKNIIEYNDYINSFIGEYRNGKRNGKGKEYCSMGWLEFEGEYINGERNGKGKEYYLKNKVDFEGEYLNGKRFKGIGKEHRNIGDYNFETRIVLWFKGEYLYGRKWNGSGYDSTYWKNGYEY